jgi:hypothetical protein
MPEAKKLADMPLAAASDGGASASIAEVGVLKLARMSRALRLSWVHCGMKLLVHAP